MKNWSDLCQNGCCLPTYTQEWIALEGQVTNTNNSRRCKKSHERRTPVRSIYLQFCTYGNPPFAVGNVLIGLCEKCETFEKTFHLHRRIFQYPLIRYRMELKYSLKQAGLLCSKVKWNKKNLSDFFSFRDYFGSGTKVSTNLFCSCLLLGRVCVFQISMFTDKIFFLCHFLA